VYTGTPQHPEHSQVACTSISGDLGGTLGALPFHWPVPFDVLVPGRKWEREKRKLPRRPKQQRYIIIRDAGSVAFLAHLPRGDQRQAELVPRSDSTKLKNRQTQVKEKTGPTADIHVVPSDVI
jgi:hypothetical protein